MDNKQINIVVGLFVILALLILLFGIYFLKGVVPGRQMEGYAVIFEQVSTLQEGDAVKVNGVKMGKVESIRLQGNRVRVGLSVRRGVRIPKDSQVRIQNIGLMGERQIGIILGDSPEILPPGSELRGTFDAGIAEAMGMAGEVFAEAETLVHSLRAVMDSTVGKPEFSGTFNRLVTDTDKLSRQLHTLIDEVDPQVKRSLANLEGASAEVRGLVREEKEPVRGIIRNGQEASARLNAVAAQADKVTGEMHRLLERMNSDRSSVGALLNDTAFYSELRTTLGSADSLFKRIQRRGLDVNIGIFK